MNERQELREFIAENIEPVEEKLSAVGKLSIKMAKLSKKAKKASFFAKHKKKIIGTGLGAGAGVAGAVIGKRIRKNVIANARADKAYK